MTQIGDSFEASSGTRFGSFRVVSLLGRGGMGTTYLAVDDRGRDVVVKTIRADLAADPTFRSRFRREAQAARLFRSTLVARVWGFDCDADLPWIALERIDGPTLNEVVDNHGPLADDRLLAFAADLADAVHAFFDQGLAHGDLTPTNVILQDGGRLKILDLGLTRPTVDEAVTSEGPVFGTPYWEAPEVSAGFHPDSASDVNQWAKLVLFAGSGYPRVRQRPLRAALDLLPQPLRDQVEKCLHPVPDSRLDPQELWRITRRRGSGPERPPVRPTGAPNDLTTVEPGFAPTRRLQAVTVPAPPPPAAPIEHAPAAPGAQPGAAAPATSGRAEAQSEPAAPAPAAAGPDAPAPPEPVAPAPRVGPKRRRVLFASLALLLAALVVAGAFVVLEPGHHTAWSGDRFAGPVIDQRHWATELENDATVESKGGAVITLRSGPADGFVSGMLSSTCTFPGDFDAEVAYRLDAWPPMSGARVGLLAQADAVERVSDPEGEFYAGQADVHVSREVTGDGFGYLRLVRSGATFFGYERVQVSDPWRQVFAGGGASTAAAHIDLKVWSAGSDVLRRVTLRDFKINVGSC